MKKRSLYSGGFIYLRSYYRNDGNIEAFVASNINNSDINYIRTGRDIDAEIERKAKRLVDELISDYEFGCKLNICERTYFAVCYKKENSKWTPRNSKYSKERYYSLNEELEELSTNPRAKANLVQEVGNYIYDLLNDFFATEYIDDDDYSTGYPNDYGY